MRAARVTNDGLRMISDVQTNALHEVLDQADIDNTTLLGLFVLAVSGGNGEVRTGGTGVSTTYGARDAIAGVVVQNGNLVWGPGTIRIGADAYFCQHGDPGLSVLPLISRNGVRRVRQRRSVAPDRKGHTNSVHRAVQGRTVHLR